jgi:hypothetical protein
MIVGLFQWKERLLIGSSQCPSPRRVLSVADLDLEDDWPRSAEGTEQDANRVASGAITRIENDFSNAPLNEAFSPSLSVNWDLVPNNFLPVDHESEDWEFAEYLIPEIIVSILQRETILRFDDIAPTFIRHWQLINGKYKTQLLDRIQRVAKLASQTRFSPYFVCGAKGMARNEARIKELTPDQKLAPLRNQLQKRFKELMDDLNSPQIAMIYED